MELKTLILVDDEGYEYHLTPEAAKALHKQLDEIFGPRSERVIYRDRWLPRPDPAPIPWWGTTTTLSTNGSVGLDTKNPPEKLQVNGSTTLLK